MLYRYFWKGEVLPVLN